MEHVNNAQNAPRPVGAYSQAVCTEGLVFCAGQIGIDPETAQLVSGGIEAEIKQVLQNLNAVLIESGSAPQRIVMTTVFLARSEDGPKVNALYSEFIDQESAPARQTVVVKELPLGALVEISVIAAKK